MSHLVCAEGLGKYRRLSWKRTLIQYLQPEGPSVIAPSCSAITLNPWNWSWIHPVLPKASMKGMNKSKLKFKPAVPRLKVGPVSHPASGRGVEQICYILMYTPYLFPVRVESCTIPSLHISSHCLNKKPVPSNYSSYSHICLVFEHNNITTGTLLFVPMGLDKYILSFYYLSKFLRWGLIIFIT